MYINLHAHTFIHSTDIDWAPSTCEILPQEVGNPVTNENKPLPFRICVLCLPNLEGCTGNCYLMLPLGRENGVRGKLRLTFNFYYCLKKCFMGIIYYFPTVIIRRKDPTKNFGGPEPEEMISVSERGHLDRICLNRCLLNAGCWGFCECGVGREEWPSQRAPSRAMQKRVKLNWGIADILVCLRSRIWVEKSWEMSQEKSKLESNYEWPRMLD